MQELLFAEEISEEEKQKSDSVMATINDLIKANAVWHLSHSAGKDSACFYEVVKKLVPNENIVVVHANLGEVEHNGVIDYIQNNIDEKLNIVSSKHSFLGYVLRRGKFASPQQRWCTSDFKTSPISKFIRNDLKKRGLKIGVNVMGLRAEESSNRAKKLPLCVNKSQTPKGDYDRISDVTAFDPNFDIKTRVIYDWLPILNFTESDVYDTIAAAGKKPHPAYGSRGSKNNRLSCIFCIMGSKNDLSNGAKDYPELYAKHVAIERVTGNTMFAKTKTVNKIKSVTKIPLEDHTGVKAEPSLVERLIPVVQLEYDSYREDSYVA